MKKALGADAPTTHVDTVLLYALILKFGWDFITHIQGMFSLVVYNSTQNEIRIYRDQSGQKNLYYSVQDGHFSFCSEIKSLLTLGNIPRKLDLHALNIATSLGYIPGTRTFIKDVFKLDPGEIVTYDLRKNKITGKTYIPLLQHTYEHILPEKVMSTVIKEHLQSNHEISINLSGGLDSSLIFHEAVAQGHKLHAFSTRFESNSISHNRDSELASRLASDYAQEYTSISITKSSYLKNFINAYKTIEEPDFNISIPIYYQTAVTEGIHGHGLRVILSGDGGDELFGGYPHYAQARRISTFKKYLTPYVVNIYKQIRNKKNIDYREVSDTFFALRSFSKSWSAINDQGTETRLYLKEATERLIENYSLKKDEVYALMLFDRFVWLANENFIRSDKLYMSQSMEMRCPLAYAPLRNYMDTHIDSKEYIDSTTNKIFLRNLYDLKLPDYITKRKDKTGWRAPVAEWYDASYKNLFLQILSSMDAHCGNIDWRSLQSYVEKTEMWPGKEVHLYLSLAILIHEFQLEG
jgi:asparagine synthase (glutamine-hydrolysing)